MKVEPLPDVVMLPVSIAGFAMPAGSSCRHDFGKGDPTCSERGSTGGRRLRGIGRQDVYLRCINNKRLEGQADGGRGRKA